MTYTAIGPKRPRKKPKPKTIACANDDFAFINGDESFQVGVEIFVCTDEEENKFEPLESGTYFTDLGVEFEVVNGEVVEIL
jgi:hypothetical protein